MSRPAQAIINLDAIRHNYLLAKSLNSGGRAVAIVKANAYGHGAIEVASSLSDIADAFGVACIEEAVELRQAGINNPILLLEGFFESSELDLISRLNLWTVIHHQQQIDMLERSCLINPIQVWLKMDLGMHRLGIKADRFHSAYRSLSCMRQVSDIVMMGHFSSADDVNNSVITEKQRYCFQKHTRSLKGCVSLSNSAATLMHPQSHQDWLRPGIMLYGASPFGGTHSTARNLKPAMTLRSEIIAERMISPGECVGYGENWCADKPTRVGTVAMGYADGYPRHAKSGTPVLVNGRLTHILGRVSMDMLAVDITPFDEECLGFPVELWGETVSANHVAECAQTIPYTLFCGISRRVHKIYRTETG